MNMSMKQNSLQITGVLGPTGNPGVLGHSGISMTPVGMIGASGISGYTGPVNLGPECVVCHTAEGTLNLLDINLENLNRKHGDKSYYICSDCLKKTKRKMKKINRTPLVMLPLHINEENIFVNNIVKKRLEKGF